MFTRVLPKTLEVPEFECSDELEKHLRESQQAFTSWVDDLNRPGAIDIGRVSVSPVVKTVTYAASVALDYSNCDTIRITLTGNLAISAITGMKDGENYTLELTQDGTGGWTFTDSTGGTIKYSTDITSIVLSTAASKTDLIGFKYRSGVGARVAATNYGF